MNLFTLQNKKQCIFLSAFTLLLFSYSSINAQTITIDCRLDTVYRCALNDLTCGTEVDIIVDYNDECSQVDVSYDIDYDGNGSIDLSGEGEITETLPYGIHTVYWFVEDDCNIDSCEQVLILEDCTLPISNCFSNCITIELGMDDQVTIPASGFTDNCGAIISFEPDTIVSSITFTCDDLGINNLTVWAVDVAGNMNSCELHIFIQDNDGSCIVATDNVDQSFIVDIFPNPAQIKDIINIRTEREIVLVSVLDIFGNEVYATDNNQIDLPQAGIPVGTYFFKVVDKDKNFSVKRVIIE